MLEILTCYITNSGYISTNWVGPLDKIGNSVISQKIVAKHTKNIKFIIEVLLLHVHKQLMLTALYAHVFSTRLRFIVLLTMDITWTSTQQFMNHVTMCCLRNSSFTGLSSLGWWRVTENRWHWIWLERLLRRSKPFQHATSKIFWQKVHGANSRIFIINQWVLQMKLS